MKSVQNLKWVFALQILLQNRLLFRGGGGDDGLGCRSGLVGSGGRGGYLGLQLRSG
jgi:hypothetical protein